MYINVNAGNFVSLKTTYITTDNDWLKIDFGLFCHSPFVDYRKRVYVFFSSENWENRITSMSVVIVVVVVVVVGLSVLMTARHAVSAVVDIFSIIKKKLREMYIKRRSRPLLCSIHYDVMSISINIYIHIYEGNFLIFRRRSGNFVSIARVQFMQFLE